MPVATESARLLPEFDLEMAATRRVLARVPFDRATWRPHPRSWSVAELASHVANIPTWLGIALRTDELDIAPPGGPPRRAEQATSGPRLLELFDRHVADARVALEGADDGRFEGAWTLKAGGHPVFSRPRGDVLRSFVLNHLVHHRGQLTVYLRLLDVALPSVYGPSADEDSP